MELQLGFPWVSKLDQGLVGKSESQMVATWEVVQVVE
jgi:hypothetical protein